MSNKPNRAAKQETPKQTNIPDLEIDQPSNDQSKLIAGKWKMGFMIGDKALQATINLEQQGQRFDGNGTDDQTSKPFKIEDGEITDNQISFRKQYEDGNSVQYSGTLQMVNESNYKGPYLSGTYSASIQGKTVTNNWEAEKDFSQGSSSSTQPPPVNAESVQTEEHKPLWPTDKAPDLSGKWEVGYEYNFKTIHSTMYLEQDDGKISGHGQDINTQEKFTIEKGWYSFPKLTIVRKYSGKAARTMTFKGTVKVVNDSDYSGPWIKGKTQGGGNWEAQLIK